MPPSAKRNPVTDATQKAKAPRRDVAESKSPGSSEDTEESDSEDPEAVEFVPSRCLFCGVGSDTFDDNMAHMSMAHTFFIPSQKFLAVDIETLIWYLNLVIYGYTECISCGSRSNTVEGIQQHMVAKGHCRFDISPDTEDFYDIPARERQELDKRLRPDDESLRLPSGKLLSHRDQQSVPAERRNRPSRPQPLTPPTSSLTKAGSSSEVATQEKTDDSIIIAAQLSRLSAGDRTSLQHLPSHEIRSMLALRMKQIDRSRRQELKSKLKHGKMENVLLKKFSRSDVPTRQSIWG